MVNALKREYFDEETVLWCSGASKRVRASSAALRAQTPDFFFAPQRSTRALLH